MENWVIGIFRTIMKAASPEIIENIRGMVQELVTRAAATPNPWDDIFAGLLQTLVGKPGEPTK